MLRSIVSILLLCLLCTATTSLLAQQVSAADTMLGLKDSERYADAVADKAKMLESKLDKKTAKALAQLKKQETSIIRKLQKTDSVAAKQLLDNVKANYKELEEKLKNPGKLQQYIPGLDSASTALRFIGQDNPLIQQAKQYQHKARDALAKVEALKAQLQKAESLKQFLKERKQYLKQQLEKFGSLHGGQVAKQLKKINKQAYYYAQQINEYKAILNDPKKIEKKALELLSKTKVWKDFFRKNSMLASLFNLPQDQAAGTGQGNGFAGLQTRMQVTSFMQQVGFNPAGSNNIVQQNIDNASGQISALRNKIESYLNGQDISDIKNFKPNSQKTKSFFKRLELGTNFQSQKANNLFPVTSDLGFSLGYKLNDKSLIGIGASYRLGLGRGWNDIKLTTEGVGIRGFVDIKLKGSYYLAGGFEQNYRQILNGIVIPGSGSQELTGWQKSGLLGFTKIISTQSKFFKKTKLQLLWDFLSYQQLPRTQPIIFRIGYTFK